MGWWRKTSFQNNDEEGISYHHFKKIDFPFMFVCVHSQAMAVCSCSYLAKSRTKSYYLYKKTTPALVAKKKMKSVLRFPV